MGELNDIMAAGASLDDDRFIAHRRVSVGEHFAVEAPTLQPLPDEAFDATAISSHRVDTKARVCVRLSYYSVPARYVRRRLDVRVGAELIEVLDGSRVVALHSRVRKGDESLVLDHYLEVLETKPGALLQAAPLAAARQSGAFTATHERFWATARRRLGDADGTRALVGVLLAQRTLPAEAVEAGMTAALRVGSVDVEVVTVEARRATETTIAPIIAIGDHTTIDRPTPNLNGYDTLLEATP